MADKPSILFVWVHNAGHSQLAAGYLNHLADGQIKSPLRRLRIRRQDQPCRHLDALLLAVLGRCRSMDTSCARAAAAFDLPTGAVYPASPPGAGRADRQRLADVDGRRRRTYHLTPSGRAALGEQRAIWEQFSTAVTAVLGRRAWRATR